MVQLHGEPQNVLSLRICQGGGDPTAQLRIRQGRAVHGGADLGEHSAARHHVAARVGDEDTPTWSSQKRRMASAISAAGPDAIPQLRVIAWVTAACTSATDEFARTHSRWPMVWKPSSS